MSALIETVDLCKDFGAHRVLDRINLGGAPGEIYSLLGANGAGKTTLINLFLNFLEPNSGKVLVGGLDVTEHSLATKRDVAYAPEQVMLYGVLSGLENLEHFATLATGRRAPREELLALLQGVGMDGKAAARRVSIYSKGMRQEVGIAIAVANNAFHTAWRGFFEPPVVYGAPIPRRISRSCRCWFGGKHLSRGNMSTHECESPSS